MRRLFSIDGPFPPVLLPILGAMLALAAVRGPANAQELAAPLAPAQKQAMRVSPEAIPAPAAPKTRIYILSGNDGYGVADCFKQGEACGRVVASSWCEAHGHGEPAAWGEAADLTASIPASRRGEAAKGGLVISCHE